MTHAILLLAAGASRRFGPENKLLQGLEGKPLIRHAADAVLAVPAGMVLAAVSDPAVAALLPEFLKVFVATDQPISESLKSGIAMSASLGATSVLVVLGDMPRVSSALIAQVLARGGPRPSAASDGVRVMPPASLPDTLFAAVAGLTGDQGAGAFLRDLPASQRIIAAPAELIDIDTLTDLARLSPG